MLRFAPAVFLSAFLLFQVQPLVARFILPWFGGTSSVWTVCMLFFQCMLLAGYAYAHLSTTRLRSRAQWFLHGALLLAAACTLPIIPSESLKPTGTEDPTLRVLALLLLAVGLPYLALAATGPLLQAWFARRNANSPYPLYALSNAGSLLALLSYPVLVEPWLGRFAQAWMWSAAFVVCSALCLFSGWRIPDSQAQREAAQPVSMHVRLLWVALPCAACATLLATTNQLCLDVASVPFLWVLPLSLYLLTFIIAFAGPRAYWRVPMMLLMLASVIGVAVIFNAASTTPFSLQVLASCWCLFFSCMVCHGELYRLRPHAGALTGYYLAISLGGALGGVLVAVVAPWVFTAYLELPLSLAACVALGVVAALRETLGRVLAGYKLQASLGAVCLLLATALVLASALEDPGVRLARRNFYGVLRVREYYPGTPQHQYSLYHGSIEHGFQYQRPDMRRLPTSYYGEFTGVGLAINSFPRRPKRVGVVGLGTGTLATYGQPGDRYVFYDINEDVVEIAQREFTFLADTAAETEIVVADARLALEREKPRRFDVLVLDAFSGDAIPVHLLTLEAMEVYRRHLREDGVLCVHISNRHMNLAPVVQAMAGNWAALHVDSTEDPSGRVYESDWIIVTNNPRVLEALKPHGKALAPPPSGFTPWTDDFSNLLSVLEDRS